MNIDHEIIIPHRLQKLEICDNTGPLKRIFNVYAPSDVGAKQTNFYKTLTHTIGNNPTKTVVTGDFNMITDDIDAKYTTNFKLTPAAKVWKYYTDAADLIDVFRNRFPHRRLYTVMKHHQSRRIDRSYTSSDLENKVTSFRYTVNTVSDHMYVINFSIKSDCHIRWGKAQWRNNVSLYKEPEVKDILQIVYND